MTSFENTKALLLALITTSLAMAVTLGTAGGLRREARRTSHQQITDEQLFEPATSTSPALVTRGRELYLDSCAHCHAADARGDEGPDLHGVEVSDRYIATIITKGIKGEMPSFAKKLHAAEITALTAYVRSLE